jgi:phosphoglycerate dehydrogenase-like enzyme
MKLYITIPEGELRESFLDSTSMKTLEENFDVVKNESDRNLTEEELAVAAKDFDVLVTGWGTANLKKAGLTDKGTRLKLLVHTGGSVGDLVDSSAYDNGLTVISGNSIYARSTAEGAFAYILTGLRQIPHEVSAMKEPSYWDSPRRSEGLFGRDIGIIGLGAVARSLIEFLKPFGVKIRVYDTYEIDKEYLESVNARQTTLEEVLTESTVVSLHAALNEKTRGMIGRRELSMIRDGALLVNTSRGPIIDENALTDALSTGRFRAVLDVFHHEPLSPDSPFRKMDNVYLIPHKAGPTFDLRGYIGHCLTEDAVRFIKGESLKYGIDRQSAERMTRHG